MLQFKPLHFLIQHFSLVCLLLSGSVLHLNWSQHFHDQPEFKRFGEEIIYYKQFKLKKKKYYLKKLYNFELELIYPVTDSIQ